MSLIPHFCLNSETTGNNKDFQLLVYTRSEVLGLLVANIDSKKIHVKEKWPEVSFHHTPAEALSECDCLSLPSASP